MILEGVSTVMRFATIFRFPNLYYRKKLSSEPGCRMEISVETNYPIVRNGCSKCSGVFRDVRGAAKCYRY